MSSLYDEPDRGEPPSEAEVRSHGSVGGKVYGLYFRSLGNCCVILSILFLVIFTQLLASCSDYWIAFWVNIEERNHNLTAAVTTEQPFNISISTTPTITETSTITNVTLEEDNFTNIPFTVDRNTSLYIFSALTLATICVTLVRSFLFFYSCTKASKRLHNHMFDSITRTTMRFFNNNSSGQILNRFSKDIGNIDEMLPGALMDCLQIGLTMLGITVVIAIVNIWLAIPTLVMTVILYTIRRFYMPTSRSIKRLEGVTRSPIYGHLNASIQGLTTIRAFQVQSLLEKEFDRHQDLHSSAFYIFNASNRAFALWLDVICLIYIGLITFSFLVLNIGNVFGGDVGLTITQCIGLTGMVQWGMRQSAELENQMTSVERVVEYTELEKEPPLESNPGKKPATSWPRNGRVEFAKVFLSYSPNEKPVLKNLYFLIEPKEKVGIVGRTGAGKSSLIAALFRLADVQGEIIIDGINTKTIGLHDLRSKISIIPQEPILFSGTVRKNLDPFDAYSDHVLWSALEEVELKDIVSDMPEKLNGKMAEGGSNFSVGQRQLICLARAIVRENKILVMDEATANVDPQTDAFIQTTIRRKFAQCTVLTIAHRLHTVMDSDKILVMGEGSVLEYNHPHLLLQNKNSTLYSMVEQTGKASAEILHKTAAENYRQKKNTSKIPVKK
uniref:ABC transmembrane type-1 domain-containing protein n=1 Tax=Clastoptera arizonana TaxID=38151 RepID=A0A1B6EBU9_9HEMI